MWKSSDMWGRDVPGSLMGPLGRRLDQMLSEMQMAKMMPTRAQTGMTPSEIEIDAISVLLGQRTWLHSVCVWKTWVTLNSNVMD